jgi:hypothetical protein
MVLFSFMIGSESGVIFASPFDFFSNAGQFQSRTSLDVILERFRRVVAKVGLKRSTCRHRDCWKETIHRWSDSNFTPCKLRLIKRIIMVDGKIK